MKNIAVAVFMLLSLLILHSCKRNQCGAVTCAHGTKQNSNVGCACLCDSNYKGQYCDTLVDRINFAFLGPNGVPTAWSCTDNCNNHSHYTCTMFGDTASTGVKLLGFANLAITDTLYLQISTDSLGFYGSQFFNDTVVTNLIGSISSNGKTITVTYMYGSNVANDTCSATWTKQ